MSQDMTWQEVRAEMKALRDQIGPLARVQVSIDDGGISGYVNDSQAYKFFNGESFALIIGDMKRHTEELARKYTEMITRKMAHSIIDITAETSSCSAAQLRMKGYSDIDIERHGPAACARADSMAASGPFSIIPTSSNQVAAE